MTTRLTFLPGAIRLALCLAGVCLIWGFLLPHIAEFESVSEHSRILEQHGVDASAMFYTELRRDLYLTDRDVQRRRQPDAGPKGDPIW